MGQKLTALEVERLCLRGALRRGVSESSESVYENDI